MVKRSWVWKYFKDSGKNAICEVLIENNEKCGKILQSAPKGLAEHLKRVHGIFSEEISDVDMNQQEVYVTFLEQNPCFARGTINEYYDHSARDKDYNKLTELLNNTVGARKDKKQWQETFADWRSKLLKRYRYHYSEKARKSLTEKQIKSMKKFDEFDIRALKALGKWGDKICLNAKPRNSGLNKNRNKSKDESEEEEAEEDQESLDDDFFNYDETNEDNFHNVNIKEEIEFDDPLIEEIPAQPNTSETTVAEHILEPERKKRRLSDDKSKNALEENTKAIKQYTAAILGLTNSINALTDVIKSYIQNKS